MAREYQNTMARATGDNARHGSPNCAANKMNAIDDTVTNSAGRYCVHLIEGDLIDLSSLIRAMEKSAPDQVQAFTGLIMSKQMPFAFETVFSHWKRRPDGSYESKADIIMGSSTTPPTVAVSTVANEAGIPHFGLAPFPINEARAKWSVEKPL